MKAWNAADRSSIIWDYDLSVQIKRDFFQAVGMSILLYGCTTWTLRKRRKKFRWELYKNAACSIE